MFKTFRPSLLAGAIAVLAGGQAFAQTTPTTTLTVIGNIAPPTCDVAVTNNGKFDYGNISPTVIGSTNYDLGNQTQTLSVTCDGTTFMLFTNQDNEAASVSTAGQANYGLGMVNNTGKLGYYTLTMQNATVDGVTSRVGNGANTAGSALTFCGATQGIYTTGHKWTWCSNTTSVPLGGQVFVADFVTNAYLNTETGMNGEITTTVPLQGSATLTFQLAL